MRPLDFLGRIKAKLGIVILLAVAVAILVNEYGRYLGVPGLARMAVAGLISLAMAQLLGRGMTRPLRQMAAAAQTIAKGRYDLRVSATSRDEVGELARAFNAMAADLGEVDRQRRELVANVSHELRTPITGLQAVLENVVDGVSPPDRATLGTALAQTERLGRLVTQLLDLSRLDSGARLIEPEVFDLASLCRQAVRESRLARDDVSVEYSVPVNVTLFADPALLAQVLANLLDNAVRHSPPGGVVLLQARVTEQTVQITITDQGPGIPPAERIRVFERFSRLDAGRTADAGGAGLGLAIAKEIVEMHGGSLQASDPAAGRDTGCRMVIDLPRSLIVTDQSEPALPPPAMDPAGPRAHAQPSIPEARPDEGSAVPRGDGAREPAAIEGTGGRTDDGGPAATHPEARTTDATNAQGADGQAEAGHSRSAHTTEDTTVTDSPTTPTHIGRPEGTASAASGMASGAGGDAQGRVGEGPQGDTPRGEIVASGASGSGRTPAERNLSTVDTLASGLSVAAVLEYPSSQATAPPPPYGPPPPTATNAGAAMLTTRTVLGGVLGAVVGFFGGIVLALVTAATFESGGIALATLLFTTVAGMMLGAALGQRSGTQADAPGQPQGGPAQGIAGSRAEAGEPRTTGATGDLNATGAAGAWDRAATLDGTRAGAAGAGAESPVGAGSTGVWSVGAGTFAQSPGGSGVPRPGAATGAGGVGVRRTSPQEYVPPPLFPRPVLPKAPMWMLPAACAVGVVAAIALPYNAPGLGFVVVAVLMGLAALPAARHRVTPWTIAFGLVAYALVAFALFRDAEWLVGPLLAAAFGLAALAVSGGGRGWLGAIRGGMSVPLAMFQLPWFLSEPVKRLAPRLRMGPLLAGTALTVVLVAIFAVLFSSADAVFSSLVDDLFQTPVWAESLPIRILAFVVFAALVSASILVALRPVAEPVLPDMRLRASRTLWMMPLTALNLLFAAFVTVQITVLFGGNERVLSTANLSYAEYARSGFFELVTVSVFVLAIVAAASGGLALGRGRDRWWLAGLLGVLCVLTLVILASALHRLNLYTDAYGLSRLRASVIATSWWLAAVFVLVIVAGAVRLTRGRATWLPRALILLTGLSLVAFAAWNPDLRVAETQHRIRGVERLDYGYLRDLGAEAVPALDRLPEPARSCVLTDVYHGRLLGLPEASWAGWNLARARAREIIERRPIIPQQNCPY
ncbi:DUF4153 domain-containing protein [Thermopolyspora sp. NPDC052614]|uniref:DUF4153 domain-containing protein n=1 Tax=Thermopolyspora sp. NPDC052614 TaxID=3155682 RepID=UPI003417C428